MNGKVRTAIYICVVLWLVALAQIGTTWLTFSGGSITQAFTRNQLVLEKSVVEAKLYLGTKSLNEGKIRQEFGEQAVVQTVTQGGLRYGHIRIENHENVEGLLATRSKLQHELMKTEQEELVVTAYVEGHTDCVLTKEQQEKMSMSLLEHVGALQISEHRGSNFYAIYGFTTGITDTIAVNGRRANINIVMTEDEQSKQTKVILGIPLVETEY